MVVKITFEDKFTLEQELYWEFKNTNLSININVVTKIILDSFNEASDFFSLKTTTPFDSSEIEIKVLMRSPDKSSILAYFDLSGLNSNSTKFCFKIYADVLFPLIKEGNIDPLNSIWVHEIMHLVDYHELERNLKLFSKTDYSSHRLYFNAAQGDRKDRHLIFLQLIIKFRQEGVAMLMQYIYGGITIPYNASEAVGLFYKISEQAYQFSISPDLQSRQISSFFEDTVNPLSYQTGAGIVLYGLRMKHPENTELKEVETCLASGGQCTSTASTDLIMKIKDFSTFDFLVFCLDPESVYREIFTLTSDYADNLQIYSGFFASLNRITSLMDRNGFVWMMSNIMGSTMSFEEIKDSHQGQMKSQTMPEELISKSESLFNYYLKNKDDEVSHWALTYLYDQADLLNDNIDYFGYIDDLPVINSAIKLINLCTT
jgi:hypothetical protein